MNRESRGGRVIFGSEGKGEREGEIDVGNTVREYEFYRRRKEKKWTRNEKGGDLSDDS